MSPYRNWHRPAWDGPADPPSRVPEKPECLSQEWEEIPQAVPHRCLCEEPAGRPSLPHGRLCEGSDPPSADPSALQEVPGQAQPPRPGRAASAAVRNAPARCESPAHGQAPPRSAGARAAPGTARPPLAQGPRPWPGRLRLDSNRRPAPPPHAAAARRGRPHAGLKGAARHRRGPGDREPMLLPHGNIVFIEKARICSTTSLVTPDPMGASASEGRK